MDVRLSTQASLVIYQKKSNKFRKILNLSIYIDYGEALMMENLERLKDRRERDLCEKLFREIEENENHKLHVLLPETNKDRCS